MIPALDIALRKTLRGRDGDFELDVTIRAEERRVVILGPSGAGKSITLKAIAGLVRPDCGHVRLGGQTLFDRTAGIDLPPRSRRIGYLFQDYALFPHMTVRQNIGFGLRSGWFNPPGDFTHQQVEHWMRAFDIGSLGARYPDQLSGGQRQRVALARALATRPRALLLDEPFSSVDADLRREMRAELAAIQKHFDTPMILITHDPEDAHILGDRLIRIRDGKVAEA